MQRTVDALLEWLRQMSKEKTTWAGLAGLCLAGGQFYAESNRELAIATLVSSLLAIILRGRELPKPKP